jgi:CheY-like chemotaxis protein
MHYPELDRRRGRRATGIVGSATVAFRSTIATFIVGNLSSTGTLLVGTQQVLPGEAIEVFFDADGDRLTGLRVEAEVVRCEELAGGRWAIAVAFRTLPEAIADHIEELVEAAFERRRAAAPATVLVVDASPEASEAVVRDLGASSTMVVAATTPLDIVRSLDDPDLNIEAALVDVRFGDANGLSVLGYIAVEHPTVRRILVVDRAGFRDAERVVTSGRAHAVLTKPWERECLLATLFE